MRMPSRASNVTGKLKIKKENETEQKLREEYILP